MKKPINIIGFLLILILIAGVVFKRLHFPGASILLVTGIVFFILIYLPFYISWVYKAARDYNSTGNIFIAIMTISGIITFCLGSLFKIMHWPGAGILIWVGIGVIISGLIIFLILNRKQFFQSLSMISVLLAILILGTFSFNINNIRQYKNLLNAEKIINPVLSESTDQIREYCINSMNIHFNEGIRDSEINLRIGNLLSMAISLDDELNFKTNQLRDFIERAESEGLNYSARMERINSLILKNSFLIKLDEDLNRYRESIYEFQVEYEIRGVELQKYLINDFDYIQNNLKSIYFGSEAIYSEEVITIIQIWRNRIWRSLYNLEEKLITGTVDFQKVKFRETDKIKISISLKAYLA
jgi:hypothetical protein